MKLKTLALCVAVLAVLAGVAYFAGRPDTPPAADPRIGQPLLPPEAAASATKIIVADQGKSVTVDRRPDGTWVVASYYDLPADFSKISRLIDDLNGAKLDRLVTSNPDRLARLEFKDSQIELFDAAGKEYWDLVLGKTQATGSGRFVRFGGENKAFATGLQTYLDPDPKNWADAQLLALKPEDVKSIELPLDQGGPVVLRRAKPADAWTATDGPEGRKLKPDAVNTLLSSLASLRFSDTTATDDPAAKEARKFLKTYTLTTFDGKTVRIALGRRPEEKKLKLPVADAKSGPASLGKAADAAKPAEAAAKPGEAKPGAPEFETIPAGPVFASLSSSDGKAAINGLMKRRAFEIDDYTFTSLPKNLDDLFDPAPAKPVAAKTALPVQTDSSGSGSGAKAEPAK